LGRKRRERFSLTLLIVGRRLSGSSRKSVSRIASYSAYKPDGASIVSLLIYAEAKNFVTPLEIKLWSRYIMKKQ
jgi:hypothetical protein